MDPWEEWKCLRKDPARNALVDRIQAATTLDEIRELRSAVRAWLRYHPDDEAMLVGGDVLMMAEETLTLRQEWC